MDPKLHSDPDFSRNSGSDLKLFCQTENIPSEAENILAETENIPSEVQNIPSIPVNSRRSYLKLFLSKEAKAKFSNFNFKLQICNLTGHY